MFRIGTGSDTHRLVEGRPLVLGGVNIVSDRGADGHSDADALVMQLRMRSWEPFAKATSVSTFPTKIRNGVELVVWNCCLG